MKEKKEAILRRELEKKLEKADKVFKKLTGEDFFCEEDALKAAKKWIADFPFSCV